MAKRIQTRRGTTAQIGLLAGAVGEVTVDTTTNTVRVHDGVTYGGVHIARENLANVSNNTINVSKVALPGSPTWGKSMKMNSSLNAWEVDDVGAPVSCQVFTTSGTWTKPAGVVAIRVQVVGAGGGACGHAESGGGGGYSEKIMDVRSIASVTVTVGSGGAGLGYHQACGDGGASSFGAYCSAGGGYGANRQGGHCGGAPGIGSGGNLNIYGGGGSGHGGHAEGKGGSSFFGGGPLAQHTSNANHAYGHESHASPGAGGQGGYTTHSRGANGLNGIVVVWEYK